jgi:hypothetical protein
VNCRVFPTATLGLAGVITIPVSAADDTVSAVDPVTPALTKVALTVVEPALMGVARPLEPKALLMDAMVLFEDFQVTWVVRSWVDLSEKVPVAVNCWDAPRKIVVLTGVTVMADSVAVVTVRVTGMVFITVPSAAVMLVVPAPADVASPLVLPALLIVAMETFDEFQATNAVISRLVPSV